MGFLNGVPWDAEPFERAALRGHLDLMKWLFQKGCPWSEETFQSAACHGKIDNLKEWLFEKGCPWSKNMFSFCIAGRKGHWEVMKWLHEKEFPWDDEHYTTSAYYQAKIRLLN